MSQHTSIIFDFVRPRDNFDDTPVASDKISSSGQSGGITAKTVHFHGAPPPEKKPSKPVRKIAKIVAVITFVGVIVAMLANFAKFLEWLGYSPKSSVAEKIKPPVTAPATPAEKGSVVSNNQSGGITAGAVTVTVNQGLTKEETQTAITEGIQRGMAEIQRQQGSELDKKYPLGYAIFTLTRINEIVPFHDNDGNKLRIDWTDWEMTVEGDKIRLLGPSIQTVGTTVVLGAVKGAGNYYRIPRRVGAGIGLVRTDWMGIRMDVVATKEYGDVLVVGAVPLSPKP